MRKRVFTSIKEMVDLNKSSGRHFFSAATLRFFDSRIGRKVYADRLFTTSEQHKGRWVNHPRKWSLRCMEDDGSVTTIGEFQEYATGLKARRAARKIEAGRCRHHGCSVAWSNDDYSCGNHESDRRK